MSDGKISSWRPLGMSSGHFHCLHPWTCEWPLFPCQNRKEVGKMEGLSKGELLFPSMFHIYVTAEHGSTNTYSCSHHWARLASKKEEARPWRSHPHGPTSEWPLWFIHTSPFPVTKFTQTQPSGVRLPVPGFSPSYWRQHTTHLSWRGRGNPSTKYSNLRKSLPPSGFNFPI